jgi:hypothetical protein
MVTKKPARVSRSTPARMPSRPATAPPALVSDGTVLLVHHGGATLNFRDGSGAKRRVLRGIAFTVDAVTAALLLRTDPSISVAEAEVASPTAVAPESEMRAPDAQDARQVPASVAEPIPPVAAPPAPGPGAITLGDLPPSAKIGGL